MSGHDSGVDRFRERGVDSLLRFPENERQRGDPDDIAKARENLRLARLEDYNSGTALPGLSLSTICEGEVDAKSILSVHSLLCLLECYSRSIRQKRATGGCIPGCET
jgi:hypothetical protein